MSSKVIPEQRVYWCDFFCNSHDSEQPKYVNANELRGLKLNNGQGGWRYPLVVSPLSKDATLHICRRCHGALASSHVQATKTEEAMKPEKAAK